MQTWQQPDMTKVWGFIIFISPRKAISGFMITCGIDGNLTASINFPRRWSGLLWGGRLPINTGFPWALRPRGAIPEKLYSYGQGLQQTWGPRLQHVRSPRVIS